MVFRYGSSIVFFSRKYSEQAVAPWMLLHQSLKDGIVGKQCHRFPAIKSLQRFSEISYQQRVSPGEMRAERFRRGRLFDDRNACAIKVMGRMSCARGVNEQCLA